MDEPSGSHCLALLSQAQHELNDADDQHDDAQRHKSNAEVARGCCAGQQRVFAQLLKPKLISASEVRITDIKVRSALMRLGWNAMPVRRAASSSETLSNASLVSVGVTFLPIKCGAASSELAAMVSHRYLGEARVHSLERILVDHPE